MDSLGDLASLGSADPRVRFAAEDRLRAAGSAGIEALSHAAGAEGAPDLLRERASDLVGSIVRERALAAFRDAVPDPSAPDLWAGAVAIAAEAHPGVDARSLEEKLAEIVDAARRSVPAAGDVVERATRLAQSLHDEQGFAGDAETYADPKNSYMPDVLERRRGIPVTLAVLWITVAERLGIPSAGVGLPLHFVVRCETEGDPLYVDAFHGTVLDEEGCRRLVARAAGRDVKLPPRAFRPLRSVEVLSRMLRNLRAIHEGAGRLHMAWAALDRALHLDALDGAALRERAFLLARLSRPAAAARSLARALALEPSAPDRETLEAIRRRLVRAAVQRN